ncbi:MAG: hypothetical protein IPP72_16390 [Chitinophagaceae bacterium]|nr:hypothetical protein [Chitinophagaceae bacterium]
MGRPEYPGNDPGTSTVIFSMPGTTISGNARFYNVIIADGADITNHSGNTMKIANTITRQGSGKWYADLYDATIEYNGGNQTIVTTDMNPYYHKLVLSGSGTKTLPAAVMSLHGDLVLQGSVTATAADPLTINGNLVIEAGTTFSTGNFNHIINGNIDNSGNLITAPGYNITLNGMATQAILGDSISIFDNLVLSSNNGAGIYSDVSINNTLTLDNGILVVGPATLGINGAISKTSGKLDVSGVSSLNFSGTSAIT